MIFDPIRVVTRPKKNNLGTHFGVYFPDGQVYDYTAEQGFRRITIEQFRDGSTITVIREIPWHAASVVRSRLEHVMRNPLQYDLLQWNCETFAEWLTSGVAKSNQVIAVVTLAGAFLALAILARVGG